MTSVLNGLATAQLARGPPEIRELVYLLDSACLDLGLSRSASAASDLRVNYADYEEEKEAAT